MTMLQFFRQLPEFLEVVWHKKIWVAATLVWLYLLNFMLGTFTGFPGEMAALMQAGQALSFETDRLALFKDGVARVNDLLSKQTSLLDIYKKALSEAGTKALSPEAVGECSRRCEDLRYELAGHIGFFNGIRSGEDSLRQSGDAMSEALSEVEEHIADLEQFLEEEGKGDKEKLKEMGLRFLRQASKSVANEKSAFESLSRGFEERSASLANRQQNLTLELRRSKYRIFAVAPASVYIFLYVYAGVLAYVRYRRETHEKKLPRRTSGSRDD